MNKNMFVHLIGTSQVIQNIVSNTKNVATTSLAVLICGETGTGKRHIAHMIHQLSPRKKRPFIEINCAPKSDNTFDSELFGRNKGSIKGDSPQRQNVFGLADKGTLFLDEFGELTRPMQTKLSRALKEQKMCRIGSKKSYAVDVRIVAATNRDLQVMVDEHTFREDLYRINSIKIKIPPLRHHKEDIPELVDFFLKKNGSKAHFNAHALTQLNKYNFPGNSQELEHIVKRTITLARSSTISLNDLPPEIRHYQGDNTCGNLTERLARVEKQMLISALESHDWEQSMTAFSLGISERVLCYKMDKAGITPPGQ